VPVSDTSGSEQAPAGRTKRRSSLLRVAVVVGLPVLSVILRLPMWFTLTLMLGLAVFLFFNFNLARSQKPDADPRRAWTQLMNHYVRLQAAYDTLKQSPSDEVARKRFLTTEQACLALLSGRPDSEWGQDAEYAAKVRNEVSGLSAAARAECGDLVPAPVQPARPPAKAGKKGPTPPSDATTAQPPRPVASSDISSPVEGLDLTPASRIAVTRPVRPASPVRPEAQRPDAEPNSTPAAKTITPHLDTPPTPVETKVPTPATGKEPTPTSEAAPVEPVIPAPPVQSEVSPIAKEQGPTPVSDVATPQPATPAQPAKPDVPTPSEEKTAPHIETTQPALPQPDAPEQQEHTTAASGTAPAQPVASEPTAMLGVPIAEEKQGLPPLGEIAAVQPVTLPAPVQADATPAANEQDATAGASAKEKGMPAAGEVPTLKPDAALPAALPEVPLPVEQPVSMPASEAAAVQPVIPVTVAEPQAVPRAEEDRTAVAGEALPEQPAAPTPPAEPDAPLIGTPQTAESETVTAKSEGTLPAASLDVAGTPRIRLMPFLWVSGGVEDAARFYASVFKDSRVVGVSRHPDGSPADAWSVASAAVRLDGQDVMLLGGGSVYRPPETSQLLVRCRDQAEVDYYWERLLAGGGEESAGGWLKDRFGVSWQVIPDALMELLVDPEPHRAARAAEAMTKMKRIDIAVLREAVSRS